MDKVELRAWKDTIENTETHNSSLRLTTEEGEQIEDLITDLKRTFKLTFRRFLKRFVRNGAKPCI
jgi:hypothetical protein